VLADLVLILHFAFVLFVVFGLGLVWLGLLCGWRWASNFWFRASHLAAIGVVALEALVGWACPLTVLEDRLRSTGQPSSSFIARWLHRLLFWDLPAWVFSLSYIAFGLLVLATWVRWPPQAPVRKKSGQADRPARLGS